MLRQNHPNCGRTINFEQGIIMQLRCDLTFICSQKVLTFAASYVVGNLHFFPNKKLSKVNSLELNK